VVVAIFAYSSGGRPGGWRKVTMQATPTPEHIRHIAGVRAERAAVGRSPFIESESVYRLLAAVLVAKAACTQDPKTN
jgi:hypothetical protein